MKEKHIAFGNNKGERENTSAALRGDNSKGNDKEDEFKKVFCDKGFFFFRLIRLVNSILSFGSWISMLQRDIT